MKHLNGGTMNPINQKDNNYDYPLREHHDPEPSFSLPQDHAMKSETLKNKSRKVMSSIQNSLPAQLSREIDDSLKWIKANPYRAFGIFTLGALALRSATLRGALKSALSYKAISKVVD